MFHPIVGTTENDPSSATTEVSWWGQMEGLRCGRVTGQITRGGWNRKVSSADAVWLWLNREGEGLIWGQNERFFLKPGMYAMTGGEEAGEWSCLRHPGTHVLEVVVISRKWLQQRVGTEASALREGLAKGLSGGGIAFCGLMSVWERELCEALARAERTAGAPRLLAEARVLEWAAARLFRHPASSVENTIHANNGERSPVKRAIRLLQERLDQPLDLSAIAREVGVSPHHLSRKVHAETGLTLLRHLRRIRIERACEALDSDRMNVTEVALEVGYQSLSHFAKAFREETGRSPSEWLGGNGQ